MQMICLISFIVLLPALVLPEVTPFVECAEFFANPGGTRAYPTIFRQDQYKQICQKYNDTYQFATLYNTAHRIPVYSAYRFLSIRNYSGKETWKIEPQLEVHSNFQQSPNMNFLSSVGRKTRKNKTPRKNQADDADYRGTGYDRGHLFPVSHACTQNSKVATFTLTNAAPQDPELNKGKWSAQEKATKKFVRELCNYDHNKYAYVVTGVVPGTELLNNRVIIPSYFWSAYCCLDNSLQPIYSRGFINRNNNIRDIKNITVEQLERILSMHYDEEFFVFENRCLLQNLRNEAVLPTSPPNLSMIQDRIVNNSSLNQDQVQQRGESEMRLNSSSELGSQVRVWRNTNSILDHKSDL